jgi:hypothetical protein
MAGGFLAGALFGALPPAQLVSARWNCAASGGQWIEASLACEYRINRPLGLPTDPASREQDPLNEVDR